MRNLNYLAASIQGVGNAMMLNISTACISDVIGKDNTSSAFVYGAYSLADKFSNGILLYRIVAVHGTDGNALRWIMAIIPTICAVGCTFFTWIGFKLYASRLTKISYGSVLEGNQKSSDKKLFNAERLAELEDSLTIDHQNS